MIETIKEKYKQHRLLYIFGGLIGLSVVIIIHECGHFLAAKLFGVATPTFSIGFGPTLIQIPLNGTTFQIAVLPLGGYVEMDMDQLAELSYIPKMIIVLAGIIINFAFTYVILMSFIMRGKHEEKEKFSFTQRLSNAHKQLATTIFEIGHTATALMQSPETQGPLIGPIGIISMISRSLAVNQQFFWLVLALISLNIGIFNLLPLPIFDGGKAVIFTAKALTGQDIPESALWIIMLIFLIFFLFFASQTKKRQ